MTGKRDCRPQFLITAQVKSEIWGGEVCFLVRARSLANASQAALIQIALEFPGATGIEITSCAEDRA